jgi:hypothetical protein
MGCDERVPLRAGLPQAAGFQGCGVLVVLPGQWALGLFAVGLVQIG